MLIATPSCSKLFEIIELLRVDEQQNLT